MTTGAGSDFGISGLRGPLSSPTGSVAPLVKLMDCVPVLFWLASALALAIQAPDASGPLARGLEAFEKRDFASAIRLLEPLCADPSSAADCARARLALATSYFLLSRFQDAAASLARLSGPERASAEVLHMSITSNIHLGDQIAALRDIAALYRLPPDSPEARLMLARMMIRNERESEAERILHELAALKPPPPGANYFLGIVYLHLARLDDAIAALDSEARLNPAYADVHYKLGDAYSRKQQWNQAIPHLQKSIWLNPDQSGPYFLLGKAYFQIGNLTNAEAMLRRALAIDPNSSSATYALAQVLSRAGRRDEAKALFERVRTLQKKNEQ